MNITTLNTYVFDNFVKLTGVINSHDLQNLPSSTLNDAMSKEYAVLKVYRITLEVYYCGNKRVHATAKKQIDHGIYKMRSLYSNSNCKYAYTPLTSEMYNVQCLFFFMFNISNTILRTTLFVRNLLMLVALICETSISSLFDRKLSLRLSFQLMYLAITIIQIIRQPMLYLVLNFVALWGVFVDGERAAAVIERFEKAANSDSIENSITYCTKNVEPKKIELAGDCVFSYSSVLEPLLRTKRSETVLEESLGQKIQNFKLDNIDTKHSMLLSAIDISLLKLTREKPLNTPMPLDFLNSQYLSIITQDLFHPLEVVYAPFHSMYCVDHSEMRDSYVEYAGFNKTKEEADDLLKTYSL